MAFPKSPLKKLRRILAELTDAVATIEEQEVAKSAAQVNETVAAAISGATLGRRIAAARRRIGINQRVFAASIGMSATQLCLIERDHVSITVRTLLRITGVLGVQPGELLDGLAPQATPEPPEGGDNA